MKKLLSIITTCICISLCGYSSTFAFDNKSVNNEVLEIAFNGDVPELNNIYKVEPVETKVVFDSRYNSANQEVFAPRAIPSKYDYYKTYRTGVTCKASGYPTLDVNISFYVNVFFKLDSNQNSKCVGYENPVIQSVSNPLGAQGYSNAKVVVTSYTSKKMYFKGTCTLVAGLTLKMSGTSSLSF